MALKPQSIRSSVKIWINGKRVGEEVLKDELIILSETWEDKQENFFRKMLKQGGHFRLKGVKYTIDLAESDDKRSDGSRDIGIIQIPGESQKF